MTTTTANPPTTAAATSLGVGPRVELARYTVPAGERVLYGQRVDGIVRVLDLPVTGIGRSYLAERGLECDGYGALLALVEDYVAYAGRYAEVPMATSTMRNLHREETSDDLDLLRA